MKVIIDPTVKQLFFDRITEAHNGDGFDSVKWVEKIAYGEGNLIIADEISGLMQKIKFIEKEREYYKNKSFELQKKYSEAQKIQRDMEDEIESYCDEIKYYREIMLSKGLGEYLEEYDDEGW